MAADKTLKRETTIPDLEIPSAKEESRKSLRLVLTVVATAMAVFHLYTAIFGTLMAHLQNYTHLLFGFIVLYMVFPARKGGRPLSTWYDYVLLGLSIASFGYILVDIDTVVWRYGYVTPLTWYQMFFAVSAVVVILEGARRVLGKTLSILAIVVLVYAFAGPVIPGTFYHPGVRFEALLDQLYLLAEGIISTPVAVSATFIYLFILFGSFLSKSGVSKTFIDFSTAVAGASPGGPAKVAVISSALVGTISGSAAANVVTTGSFTIPLMKKIGYKPYFAGAVESAASTGGQIMPPVMGAAAFVLADMIDLSYARVCLHAAIPAVLYFMSVYWMVHLEAVRTGLRGLPRSELPSLRKVMLERGYHFVPIFVIIALLAKEYSPMKTAVAGIVSCAVLGWLRPETRIGWREALQAFDDAARNAVTVIAACAAAGVIIGVVTLTGLGLKVSEVILTASMNYLPLALALTMVAGILFGMGLPTTAAYVLQAALLAPALVQMGVPLIAAHLFVFYFACISAITPPVAIASYAAAGVADSDPMKTGWTAMRLGAAAYIVPFMFVFGPTLLLIGKPWAVVTSFVTASIGTLALAAAMQGWYYGETNLVQRVLLLAAALLLIRPGGATDIAGVVVMALVYAWQRWTEGRRRATAHQEEESALRAGSR